MRAARVALSGGLLLFAACSRGPAVSVTQHGAPLSGAAAIPIAQVVGDPNAYVNKDVVVRGKVRKACTRKGCWMELAPSAQKGTPGCRVTFKDYAFFVPLDAAGAEATVEGHLEARTLEPGAVEHLESEGASFNQKASDGSALELRLVATGVELRRLKK